MRSYTFLHLTAALVLWPLSSTSVAQEESTVAPTDNLAAYDVRRESTLVGTVLSYTAVSPRLSPGSQVRLQTANGVIDIHLGDARFLAANHFTIESGDTLRIIGEPVVSGTHTQFLARIIQKGAQAIAVRTVRGFPLSYRAPRDGTPPEFSGAVL